MRSSVEQRRCGCGNIIGLRESCPVCANAARARLHAEGVAETERPGLPYDNGLFGIRPPSGPPRGVSVTHEQIQHALNAIDAAREAHRKRMGKMRQAYEECFAPGWGERLRQAQAKCEHPRVLGAGLCHDCGATVSKALPLEYQRVYQGVWEDGSPVYTNACGMPSRTPEPPPVGAEVSYDEAKRHMQTSPAVRYWSPAGQLPYCWSGGTLMYSYKGELHRNVYDTDELGALPWVRIPDACTGPLPPDEYRRIENLRSELKAKRLPDATTVPAPASAADKRCYCVDCRFERMEITSGERGWYRATGRCLEACTKRHMPTDGTPPAIGEEVAWERAKRDMQSRSEARYRPTAPNQNVHSMSEGVLMYHVGEDEGAMGAGMHEARARGFRWARLA